MSDHLFKADSSIAGEKTRFIVNKRMFSVCEYIVDQVVNNIDVSMPPSIAQACIACGVNFTEFQKAARNNLVLRNKLIDAQAYSYAFFEQIQRKSAFDDPKILKDVLASHGKEFKSDFWHQTIQISDDAKDRMKAEEQFSGKFKILFEECGLGNVSLEQMKALSDILSTAMNVDNAQKVNDIKDKIDDTARILEGELGDKK